MRELVLVAQRGPAFGARASFASLLEAWLAAKAASWSASTLRETKSIVSHHLIPRLGTVPVGAVTTQQLDDVLVDLRRSLSVGTVTRIRMVLHAALAQAVRWDWTSVESGVAHDAFRGGSEVACGAAGRRDPNGAGLVTGIGSVDDVVRPSGRDDRCSAW